MSDQTITKPGLLLHTCCAPCLPHVHSQLSVAFTVSVFYFNSNIYPEEEYLRRESEVRKYCTDNDIKFIVDDNYDHSIWLEAVKGLEKEPEGGARCRTCFDFRLDRTAQEASIIGCSSFTTTLSVSPHKNVHTINEAGKSAGLRHGVVFVEADFKKKDGYKISCDLARQHGFYRQHYCGCEFSNASS